MSETGTSSKETMLELYKLYVEMADRISQRRESANKYFLSINTALISLVIAYLVYSRLIKDISTGLMVGILVGVSLVGIANCWVWRSLIMSYNAMNRAKFKVIHAMEEIIGYRPYFDEWEYLKHGEDKEVYNKFTIVESYVPRVFSVGYAVVIVLLLLLWHFLAK